MNTTQNELLVPFRQYAIGQIKKDIIRLNDYIEKGLFVDNQIATYETEVQQTEAMLYEVFTEQINKVGRRSCLIISPKSRHDENDVILSDEILLEDVHEYMADLLDFDRYYNLSDEVILDWAQTLGAYLDEIIYN